MKQLCLLVLLTIGLGFVAPLEATAQSEWVSLKPLQPQAQTSLSHWHARALPVSLAKGRIDGELGVLKQYGQSPTQSDLDLLSVYALSSWAIALVSTIGAIYAIYTGRLRKTWGLIATISSASIIIVSAFFFASPLFLVALLYVVLPTTIPLLLGIVSLALPKPRSKSKVAGLLPSLSARAYGCTIEF